MAYSGPEIDVIPEKLKSPLRSALPSDVYCVERQKDANAYSCKKIGQLKQTDFRPESNAKCICKSGRHSPNFALSGFFGCLLHPFLKTAHKAKQGLYFVFCFRSEQFPR